MDKPWDQLNTPSGIKINTKRISSHHPVDLFYGKDIDGSYLFLYRANTLLHQKLEEGLSIEGIDISLNDVKGQTMLLLKLEDSQNWEMFSALCDDLIHATEAAEPDDLSIISTTLARLRKWQKFLKSKRFKIMSPEMQMGLYGELLFLKEDLIPRIGVQTAIQSWVGPEGAPQDFQIEEMAVEIKSKSGVTQQTVRINNIDQLYSKLPKLKLKVYTFAFYDHEEPESYSLNSIIESIRELACACPSDTIDRFDDLLESVDYVHLKVYGDRFYITSNSTTFDVINDFPKITRKNTHDAIENAEYTLNLGALDDFKIKDVWS